ncbi:hypothetical protein PFICI_08388 [Pestalotiopsis fici W106-1]|uniref:Uncharacterized protein n=1 Tax=Pestalotiopsis fici (strain W106-1 / CGMCC3.15140) TaxID=1229662 RepID=W3X4C4_PESFW|nr:uncharacterized protein PFICI_08388 [Pestalotiopsis fici W106-1]ETS80859.1 hypothetical protein PFICI_08388 [Pestalotiopsis fici W106-1]
MDMASTQSPARNARIQTYLGQRKRQTFAEPSRLSVIKVKDAQRAKFSYGKPLNESESDVSGQDGKRGSAQTIGWLLATATNLEQDIETCKKELELVRSLMEEIDQRLQAHDKLPSRKLRDHKVLMAACREYSDSMIQVKKERLRQVRFWASSREMGRSAPAAAPGEWLDVDLEWRNWLSEQAAARSGAWPIEASKDTAWRILGPLPHIIAAYIWLEG